MSGTMEGLSVLAGIYFALRLSGWNPKANQWPSSQSSQPGEPPDENKRLPH
jgi:hypothetical protein